MIYLIHYDRSAAKLVAMKQFAQSERQQAEKVRLDTELELLKSGISHEIVLLEATNEEELRKTHRRYFEALEDLLNPAAIAHAA
jgi:fructose-1-phosphate kinase PfkB-like protein